MKISSKQAIMLLMIVKDTLTDNLARINFGGINSRDRCALVTQIIDQQDDKAIDLDSPEVQQVLKGRKLNIDKEE